MCFVCDGRLSDENFVFQTNNMRYPLYSMVIEDGDGVGQPVCSALLAREDQCHIEKFLE